MSAERPAIAGGTPVRTTFLPLSRPVLGAAEEAAVIDVLRSGWLGTGPRTAEFENRFAATIGAERAVAVASCTAGLHLTLRAFALGPGDDVITSPMTFAATANAILHAGARPVLADVLPDRLTLDPVAVAAAWTARTRAVVAVHYAGWPCTMPPLLALARAQGAFAIEDAAHALGATLDGRAVGTLGDAAVFSFYPTKSITTGEGGMIATERAALVARLRRERLHGIDLDASQRRGTNFAHWEAVSLGWKYNLTDLQAAIGLAQLERLPVLLARRRALDARYRERLALVPAVRPVVGPGGAETAAHLFPVLLDLERLRIDRDEVLRGLLAENIGVGVHFRALPLHRHFRAVLGTPPEAVPVAADASRRLLSLPLHPAMTDADQDDVIEALLRLVQHFSA